jgi:hypothetical protein
MVGRVLRGRNPATGGVGLLVSKPGIDVRTANLMQLAFSSDYIHPKLVIKGTVVNPPTNGWGPFGASGAVPGAEQTRNILSYGRTVSPIPSAFAIATAPDWRLPLAVASAQLGYLAGRWHSHVYETPDSGVLIGEYGPTIQKTASTGSNAVSLNWHSARFIVVPYPDRLEIFTNCRSSVTIKYLVLENQ